MTIKYNNGKHVHPQNLVKCESFISVIIKQMDFEFPFKRLITQSLQWLFDFTPNFRN